jgi:predicted RNase H-like HicB family nuclease
MSTMKYGIVIESGEHNYSAYVPDLPGCVATGKSVEETKSRISEAIRLHVEGMREDGEVVPEPRTICDVVDVA